MLRHDVNPSTSLKSDWGIERVIYGHVSVTMLEEIQDNDKAVTMLVQGVVLEEIGSAQPYAGSGALSISSVELDPPGPDELLVRIQAAGLCHSDLSVVNGSRPRPMPMLLGHEAAGVVTQVGSEVNDIAVGQRVIMTFLPRCGKCAACLTDGKLPCIPGSAANADGVLVGGGRRLTRDGAKIHHHLGVSGFATYAVVDRSSVVPVDDDVPADIAAVLGCAVLTGGGAVINAGKPQTGDTVAVVGLGGVGMAAVLVAVGLGHNVVGIDPVASKLDLAKSFGATAVYTPDEAVRLGVTAPVVVEAAGSARAFETAFTVTAPGGTTVTVGLPHPDETASISPLILTAQARTVVGSYLGSAVPSRDIPRYVDMWRSGHLPLEKLISAHITLAEVPEAFDKLAGGEELRQVITFD